MYKKIKCLSMIICMLFISTAFSGATSKEMMKENILKEQYQNDGLIDVEITRPKQGYMYFNDRELIPLVFATLIIGSITVEVNVESDSPVKNVDFYMNDGYFHGDYLPPYTWECDSLMSMRHMLKVEAYTYNGLSAEKELPIWFFNTHSLPDVPPEPCIVEPSSRWTCFDPSWDSILVSKEMVIIKAVDLNLAEDIISTLFEYSSDKINWVTIGFDEYPGFEGVFLPETGKVGDRGWSTVWDLSGLSEGVYYLKATMTDESGQIGEQIKKTYYDPIPPLPELREPSFEEVVSGVVDFKAFSDADNVVSMELKLFQNFYNPSLQAFQQNGNSAWYNQSLGTVSTGDLPANCTWRGGPCCPIAGANALAGQNDSRLYPPGKEGNDVAVAEMLGKKMGTTSKGTSAFSKVRNGTTSGGQPYDIYEPDNVGAALNDYLAEMGVNCSNAKGYTVTTYGIQINSSGGACHPVPGSSTVDFDTYSEAIRQNQSVILIWMDWRAGADGKWGTPDDTVGGSHAIAGRGCSNRGTQRGQAEDHPVSFTDVDGQEHTQGWREYNGTNGNFSVLQGANTWNLMIAAMYVICPKNATVVAVDSTYIPEVDGGWVTTMDTTSLEDGFYTLMVEMTDSNGFVGRDSIVIEIDNAPGDEDPPIVQITDPENNTVVYSPYTNITGYAYDTSGIARMDYIWEWEGGSASDNITYDPPRQEVSFRVEISGLREGWNKITVEARDTAENIGSDSVTVYYMPGGEDTTPPATIKEIGEPNWEGGYAVMNYTPIWLNATDNPGGLGVNYIYYEVWWDSNINGIIEPDEWVGYMIIDGDTAEIHFEDWDLDFATSGLVGLGYYAVDNAENKEEMHYQEHFVMVE